MNATRARSIGFGAAWGALIAALVVLIGIWCATIGDLEGGRGAASGAGAGVATFSGTGEPPLQAPAQTADPSPGCLFVLGDDGHLVVMSEATGSVLTPRQAKNCDN